MRHERRNPGFTLVEMIVVIGVLGVVSTIGCIMFGRFLVAERVVIGRTDLDQEAQSVFDAMGRDFRQVLSAELSGVSLRGILAEAKLTGDQYPNLAVEDDQVIIPVQRVVEGTYDEPGQVRYFIKREGRQTTLTRVIGGLYERNPNSQGGGLSERVAAMRIEYLDKTSRGWQPIWDKPELPQAVRVNLMLMGDHPLEQVSRKAVFPINVD